MTSLIQADRHGTSVGTSLRVMAEEGRDTRMMEAEKKAASLPPKLTVPLIIFFLPVLFIVIISPGDHQGLQRWRRQRFRWRLIPATRCRNNKGANWPLFCVC